MTIFKQVQDLQQEIIDVRNTLQRLEVKIDGLMQSSMDQDDIDNLEFPDDIKGKVIKDETPYNVKMAKAKSTLPVPESQTTTPPTTTSLVPEPKKDTLPLPEAQTPMPSQSLIAQATGEPFDGYEKMTAGEIIKQSKTWDAATIDRALAYETREGGKNRETVIDALENPKK